MGVSETEALRWEAGEPPVLDLQGLVVKQLNPTSLNLNFAKSIQSSPHSEVVVPGGPRRSPPRHIINESSVAWGDVTFGKVAGPPA